MKILHRYIAKTVIQATALVVLVMIGLIFMINFLNELRDINVDYTFMPAFLHSLLGLPRALYQFFPMLVLLGGALGLGLLASEQELMVMRASGFSITSIVFAVIAAALFLVVIATLIGEGVGPRANFVAESIKKSALNGGQAIATVEGVWMHQGNNFIHVDRVMGSHHLEGVTRYEFDDHHQLLAAYFAKSLDRVGHQWQLHDLVKTTFSPTHTANAYFPVTTWNLTLNPRLLNVGLIEPAEMSLRTLFYYSQQLIKNGLQADHFLLEFWKRVIQPLTTIIMILLAIPFVFRSPRSATMGWRILFSVSLGFSLYVLSAFSGQLSLVFQFSPFLAALFPPLVFALVGYVFLLKPM